jgi:hypothetical protein
MACREWEECPFAPGLDIRLVAHILGLEQMGTAPERGGPELVPPRLLVEVALQRPPPRRESRY